MTDPQMISITVVDYESLKEAAALLDCLKAAGVDNWEGYAAAVKAFNDTPGQTDEVSVRQDAAVDNQPAAQ